MIIGINEQHQIKQIGEITDTLLTVIELNETDYLYPFKGWGNARILNYCYKLSNGCLSIYPYVDIEAINRFDEYATKMETRAINGEAALTQLIREDALTETQTLRLIDIYKSYQVGKAYAVGDIFKDNGLLYEVIQAHTSQSDWLPSTTFALYKNRTPSLLIGEWVQPTGSHDAYQIGTKVLFNGSVYESLINANVWSPTAYPQGWKKI